jgi:hypothetical protein
VLAEHVDDVLYLDGIVEGAFQNVRNLSCHLRVVSDFVLGSSQATVAGSTRRDDRIVPLLFSKGQVARRQSHTEQMTGRMA